MFKKLVFVASLAVLAGCSDSGEGSIDDVLNAGATPPVVTPPVVTPPLVTPPVATPPVVTPPVDTTPVDTTPVATPPVVTPPVDTTPVDTTPVDVAPVSANPTGALLGAWFGTTNFGPGVVVIDSNNQIAGLSTDGAGTFEVVHGAVGGNLERMFHRNSDNPAHGDSFTLAGDLPSVVDPAQSDTVAYNLAVVNDGEQLDNTGGPGNFSLTFATTNDIAAIDVAFLNGGWRAETSFCPAGCDVALEMMFQESGAVTGFTTFNGEGQLDLNGSLVQTSPVFMEVSFIWNGLPRAGVIHRDITDSSRIVLNTIGDNGGTNQSFSAVLTRQ